MTYLLYRIVTNMLAPIALLRLTIKSMKEPGYRKHLFERFGFVPKLGGENVIWIHAVSVGEIHAAKGIVEAIFNHGKLKPIITCGTASGRLLAESLFEDLNVFYIPLDIKSAVTRFLTRTKPEKLIVMETEVWPVLFECCRKSNVEIILANGRLSEKSYKKYRKFNPLARNTFQKINLVLAQTGQDQERFKSIGVNTVEVTGNIKFDKTPNEQELKRGVELRQLFGADRKVILLASTRDGEEELILKRFLPRLDFKRVLLVIVPRHPNRFSNVENLLKKMNVLYKRRSLNETIPSNCNVVLGDSMGELYGYFSAADIIFIGGSLLPHGGQNPIEAFAVGKNVIFGPSSYNFKNVYQEAVIEKIAFQIANADELLKLVMNETAKEGELSRPSTRAKDFVEKHRGALGKSLSHLGLD